MKGGSGRREEESEHIEGSHISQHVDIHALSHHHQRQAREDRQRDFEDTLMSGVSEAQREQIWQEAAKEVMSPHCTAQE